MVPQSCLSLVEREATLHGDVSRSESAANLLMHMRVNLALSSESLLKSLPNLADFDSAIRRFDPSPPQPINITG